MAKDILVGLDIGSSSIKILAVSKAKKDENFEVLGFDQEPSLGIRRGVVIDHNQVSDILIRLLDKMEEKIGRPINSVYVNVNGAHVFSTVSRGLISVSRADQKISQEDIDRVLSAAQALSLPFNKEVLDVFPKDFIVDGQKGIRDPYGLKGVRLEVEALLLGGFSPYIKNLTTAVLNSGLKINDFVFSPLASARAVLTQKEKELGVAVIDIGAGNTGISVFEEGRLVHVSVFPVGSSNITNDIAIYLKTDVDVAERIKLEYASLDLKGKDKKDKIKLDDGEDLSFSRKHIAKVVEYRMNQIFNEIHKELKKIGKHQSLPAGIVLTGGGARIPRIKDFVKKILKLPVRIGKIQEISLPENDPILAGVCGLVLTGADFEKGEEDYGADFGFKGLGIKEKIKRIFKIFIP
jgi:cell division protein FtsA